MARPTDPRFCRCCEGPTLPAPTGTWNRPGLSAVAYRVGTFAGFREAMLEGIARPPGLATLATRGGDDSAATLIELFAAAADVRPFYDERVANELSLRTAIGRDSVVRLLRLIGYRPAPGLAATAMLSFSLDAGATTRI